MKIEHFAETNQVHDKPIAGIPSSVETTVRPPQGFLRDLPYGRYADVVCQYEPCSRVFTVRTSEIKRGGGKFCSVACVNRGRDKSGFKSSGRSLYGEANHNWRGGFKAITYVRKFKAANPEKARAHQIVHSAIRSGKLIRPGECSQCHKICKPDGHHADYSKVLEVIWLCRKCHVQADRERDTTVPTPTEPPRPEVTV